MKNFLRSYPVTANDWLKYHPYTQPSSDDHYYLKLCNKLLKANIDEPLCRDLNWSEYKQLTCMLVCWFEDVISETNIWHSFTCEHKKLYGKYLPFYDTSDDYFDDEINKQDIQFLIWHFFSMLNENRLFNPFNLQFRLLAEATFELFETEYETAPPNLRFKGMLAVPDHKDIYGARNIMEFLFFKSYLNQYFAEQKLEEGITQIANAKMDAERSNMLAYDYRVTLLLNSVCPILALRSNEQLANMIGECHPRYHEIKSISRRIAATCVVKGNDGVHLDMQHIATGKRINLILDTLSPMADKNLIAPGKKRLWANMVQWGDEWALMGTLAFNENWQRNDEIAEEKHLFDPVEPKLEMLDYHEECFKDLSGGESLAYFENEDQYVEFVHRFRVHIYEKANPGKKFPASARLEVDKEDIANIVMFFNHHAGTELYPNFIKYVKDTCNSYYVHGARANMEMLITEDSISARFVQYLVTNGLIDFDQKKAMDDQTILDNLDFLLRYFKQGDYYSEPRITIVDA
jgi:hypothetical protein